MLTLNGYYDGSTVQTAEKISAKKNQKVIITVLDEFIEEVPMKKKKYRVCDRFISSIC